MTNTDILDLNPTLVTEEPIHPEYAATGKCLWFSRDSGYGFIDCNGKQYFVHYNDIQGFGFKVIKPGQFVRFTATIGPKGPVAKKVYPRSMKVVDEAPNKAIKDMF